MTTYGNTDGVIWDAANGTWTSDSLIMTDTKDPEFYITGTPLGDKWAEIGKSRPRVTYDENAERYGLTKVKEFIGWLGEHNESLESKSKERGEAVEMSDKEKQDKYVYEYVVVEVDEDGVLGLIVGEGKFIGKCEEDIKLKVAAGLGADQIEGKKIIVRPFRSL